MAKSEDSLKLQILENTCIFFIQNQQTVFNLIFVICMVWIVVMNYEISDFTQLFENKSTRFQSRKAWSVHKHLFFGYIRCFNDIHMLSKYMAHQFFDCIHIAHINP